MTFDELWKREGWFSEDTSEFELAKAAYKAGEEEARATVAAALREALATLAAIPSDDYSTDGDAEELIRRDLAMAAIVKAMKKLNIPVSYLTQEQPK